MAKKKSTMIEREGLKSYEGLSDDEVMAQRLVDAVELEYLWQVIADIYGKKVARVMRELLPADPLYFKDYFVFDFKYTNKSLCVYNDEMQKFELTDYKGKKEIVTDKYGVVLVPTTYELGKSEEYSNLISDESSKRSIFKE